MPLPAQPLYRNSSFELWPDRVLQGTTEAVADGPLRIRSNYLYNSALEPRLLSFKFALNGLDNEAPPGRDHALYLVPEDGKLVSPVYVFGEAMPAPAAPTLAAPVRGAVDVTFRVDLRPVLKAFEQEGVFKPAYGAPIRKADFTGVYIAGGQDPLSWDFNAIAGNERYRLQDPDGDGIYERTLTFGPGSSRPFDADGYAVWESREDLSGLPSYTSDQPLVDALFSLSLEEMRQNIRPDGAFAAGAQWPGVWTRDLSYSVVLALAMIDPAASMTSLRAKVSSGHIIQDTGTGGSWPVSTDRTTWALAAWEVYLATGDRAWLREAYDVIRNSVEADLLVARDPETGLFYGESSFLDWREQTYPRWMDAKDIYLSQSLGTNVVHFATYRLLARMAAILGEDGARWDAVATDTREAVNGYLWQSAEGYYGQFRYGRLHPALSSRGEALGEALAVLYGVATEAQARRIAASYPLMPFGVPTVAPQITDMPPYHNDSFWPFVGAYWTWAAAEAGNTAAAEHGLASIYRAAALFLTNKENMVGTSGHFSGTAINSDRQLWSIAGNMATVLRVFFGIRMEPERIVFQPFVPAAYTGSRTLSGFHYRDAVLDLTLEGTGNRVLSFELDGQPIPEAALSADLAGRHHLLIRLAGNPLGGTITLREPEFAPPTPQVRLEEGLRWDAAEGAVAYEVYRNGEQVATTTGTRAPVESGFAEYSVVAVGGDGIKSFMSEPVRVEGVDRFVAEPQGALLQEGQGFEGNGFVRLTPEASKEVTLEVSIPRGGRYAIEAHFANGSGPINTDNKAAIRTLFLDGQRVGPLVMPQRGEGVWNDWGLSNPLLVTLTAGTHALRVRYMPEDENMNGSVNTALLDHLVITRVE